MCKRSIACAKPSVKVRVRDHGREIGARTEERHRASGDLVEAALQDLLGLRDAAEPVERPMIPCTAGMP